MAENSEKRFITFDEETGHTTIDPTVSTEQAFKELGELGQLNAPQREKILKGGEDNNAISEQVDTFFSKHGMEVLYIFRVARVANAFFDAAGNRLGVNIKPGKLHKTISCAGLSGALFRLMAVLDTYYDGDVADTLTEETGFQIPKDVADSIKKITEAYLDFHEKEKFSQYDESIDAFIAYWLTGDRTLQQTEFSQADSFYMMVSKAARLQQAIAAEGRNGYELEVGRGAIVTAIITDREGNPVELSMDDEQIQDVIGDMIQRNGGKPIQVSPAQIWREWKQLPPDATVHADNIAFINEIMLRLIATSGEIRFQQQIAQHKGIEHQPDFDYSNPENAVLGGQLVTANYCKFTTKGQDVWGYEILKMPLYYQYSHIVGRIGKFASTLLNPAKGQRVLPKGKTKTRGKGQPETRFQRYLLRRINSIRQKRHSSGVVLIDEIAADAALTLTERSRRTLYTNVVSILTDWTSSEKNRKDSGLKSFELKKQGKKYAGWTLYVFPEPKKKKGT